MVNFSSFWARTLLLLQTATVVGSTDVAEYMEPWNEVIKGILSPDDCAKIIAVAEGKEFNKDDGGYASLEIVEDGEVVTEEIGSIIQPQLAKINEIISDRKMTLGADSTFFEGGGHEVPAFIDFISLRKYGPDLDPKSLKLTNDVALYTAIIPLNSVTENKFYLHKNKPGWFQDAQYPIPEPPEEVHSEAYLMKLQDKTTPKDMLVIPSMTTGDLLVYNHSAYYGMFPLAANDEPSYSLVFSVDVDDVKHLHDLDVTVTIVNHFEDPVDLYQVIASPEAGNETEQEEKRELVQAELEPEHILETVTGNEYVVVSKATEEVLEEFFIMHDDEEIEIGLEDGTGTSYEDDEDEYMDAPDEDEDSGADEDEDGFDEIEDDAFDEGEFGDEDFDETMEEEEDYPEEDYPEEEEEMEDYFDEEEYEDEGDEIVEEE